MTDEPPNITTKRTIMDDDLRRIFDLALDLNYYRTVRDAETKRSMGNAAWVELYHAVQNLPEGKH